jgi:putative hemolysin
MRVVLLQILFILVLIGIESYFAASEIALISARRVLLQQRAEQGSKGAVTAMQLLEDPTRLLSTIQIGITVLGFLAASAGAVSLAVPVERWLASLGFPIIARVASGLAVLLVTLVISYVTLVVGELVPKRLGLQRAEGVAVAVSGTIFWFERVARPLVWLLTVSTNGLSRLIGIRGTGARPNVSEEELKLLVTEQGTLLDEEKRMIHEIFELGDTVAREVMVPRVDMMLAEDTSTVLRTAEILQASGFSRVPIFHGNHDTIVGIVLLRDLVGPLAAGKGEEPVTGHMREPGFVPESKAILPLLSEMRALHQQIVIVVDEYGGTAGLVTLEDIVEEIVGEIADEFDREHKYLQLLPNGDWALDGRLPIAEAIERGIPVEESDEYETVAGWMLAELGHIPAPGEMIEHEGYTFRVQAMRRRRIARIRVTPPPAPAHAEAAPQGEKQESGGGEQGAS